MTDGTTENARQVRRSRACWLLIAFVGLVFLVAPVFTHPGLTTQHIVAHLITGPTMIALSLVQLRRVAGANPGYRAIDFLLAAFGLWLGSLPFVIPAEGLHIHGHAVAGIATFLAALWNAVSPATPVGDGTPLVTGR